MKISTYTREKIIPFLSSMNSWCVNFLRGYPYLYVPPVEQIINPSDIMYVNDPNALVLIAEEQDMTQSVATGIPLNSAYLLSYYFNPEIINKFKNRGYDPHKIWYMGYFLTTPEYRENGKFIQSIYEKFIKHAVKLGKTQLSYVNVVRAADHPLKPDNFKNPEPWEDMIKDFLDTGVTTKATWPTLQQNNSIKNEEHEIRFYIKNI